MCMKYDKWQQEIIDAKGDLLACTGRQVGKTTVFSHKIAQYMLNNPNKQVIVVSLTEDQAQLIIVMILDYFERYTKNVLLKTGKHKPTKSRVALKNGSRVISRPVGNTGDAVRGFTGDVLYIDEASGMPEMMWKAAMPTLMTTAGQIWMSSTPRGKFIYSSNEKNFFYKCWENLENRWQIFTIKSEDAIKEREIVGTWTQEKRDKALKFLENQKALLSDMEFRQEYGAEFLDDNRQYFEDELIRSCMLLDETFKIVKGREYYLGVDVARMGEDESTFEIFEQTSTGFHHISNIITTKTYLNQTFDMIKRLHKEYDFQKIYIDSGGIGAGVFDWLMNDEDLKFVTVAIDNSKQILDKDGKGKKLQKTVKYSLFKMLMEQGKVKLLNDEKVFQSFKSVQYAYTNDSLGTRHLKIFGNYTHIVEGCTNAAQGYKYKHFNTTIYTIKV